MAQSKRSWTIEGFEPQETGTEATSREKIVRPGITTLERFVTQVRAQAKAKVADTIEQQLTDTQLQALDALLEVPVGQTFSQLQQLKAPRVKKQ